MFFVLTLPNMYDILTTHHVERAAGQVNIQGFQKMTLLDYPGTIACTIFTGGCNLRCPFCHNAGLVRTPASVPNMEQDVLTYLAQRKGLLDGVCITGGEPLLQPDLAEFMTKVRAMGYRVKLDTNGSMPERLRHLLDSGLVDYVAMDVKNAPEHYTAASGSDIPAELFLQSILVLRESGIPHEFRTTAVKGIHTADDFRQIAQVLNGSDRYFIQRFVDSGNLLSDGWSAFSEDEMQQLLHIVREQIPGAEIRG